MFFFFFFGFSISFPLPGPHFGLPCQAQTAALTLFLVLSSPSELVPF